MAAETPSLDTIFCAAIEMASPDDRAAYIARACGDDGELRARVEKLVDAHFRAGSFLEEPAPAPDATGPFPSHPSEAPAPAERPGTVIGPYKLLQQIGEGGMGVVWMAEQTQPVQRKVALKVIKPGMDSGQVIARFEAERQALAMMDHVNIARVFDAGATEAGRPYFVMELVHGVPITKYCDDNHLTPRERLELFVPVCQAIQHAHQKGIIHRDVKPSNVMVTLYDGKPVPKVIDFGVAKATEQKLTERTLFTQYGTMVGTLEYMSPEQAEMSALGVDTRSDIYSLGVLLYELLTGNTPLTHKRMKEGAYAEILRMIKEEEPPKPSTRLSDSGEALASISVNRHMEPAKLTKLVRGELDWIVMKCLEKDRNRRYETANGFAMDVQRYLADETVQACPPSAGYRLRKFVRRNRGGLAVAALVLFFLVLLGSGVGWAARDRSAREAEAAQQRAARQGKVAGQVESVFAEVDRLEGEQKWPEALAAARRAEAAVGGGEADAETTERVRQRLKDLEFIDRLEQIRMEVLANGPDHTNRDQDYAQSFRDYGVDVEELAVETSIERLKDRPALAIPLAAALDEWVYIRRAVSKEDAADWKRLVAIAHGIDPEPLRDRLRSTWGRPVSETQDELRRLADSIDVRAHHPATLFHLGSTLRQAELPDAALRILREAQSVYPGDFWLNSELGNQLFFGNKDLDGAIRFYTAAVSLRPSAMSAYRNLFTSLRAHGKLDEGIAVCRRAIEINPKHKNAPYRDLGDFLHAQKKPDEEIAVYRQAIEARPEATRMYLSEIGHTLREQGKRDEAIAVYRQVIEAGPEDGTTCFCWLSIGDTLRAQKKFDEAIDAYKKTIELNPKYALAHHNLGLALQVQKKLPEAIDAYRKAIEIDPNYARAYNNLGIALCDQKKLDEAIDAYRKAIEIDPNYAGAYNNLGVALHARKNLDEAIAAYRKAIELDPKSADAYRNLGLTLMDQEKPEEAIAAFRKAIEVNPKSAAAHNSLGALLCDHLKDYDKAIECFRKAIELDPKYADAYRNLGVARGNKSWDLINNPDPKRRDPKRAIEAVQEAVELDPQSEIAWQWLGWVQYRIGNWRAGIEALEKSCKLQKGGTGDAAQWIVLALAHARLAAQEGLPDKERERHRTEARRWFDQADKEIDGSWRARPGDIVGQATWDFRAEARELMAAEEKKE